MTEEIPCNEGTSKEYRVGYGKPPIESQWKPGQSGNPEGKPPDELTPLLRKFLNANNEAEKIAIVRELIGIAKTRGMRGQVNALKEILDRIDGRVPETHNIKSDIPVIIQPVVYERREDAIQRQDKGQGSTQGADEEEA